MMRDRAHELADRMAERERQREREQQEREQELARTAEEGDGGAVGDSGGRRSS